MFHPQGPTFWELAHQALSSTKSGYDLLAPKFDYTPFCTPDELLAHVAPVVAEKKDVDDAIDVCCGTGAGMRMMRPLCGQTVTGIDFSEPMLRVAQRRAASSTGTASLKFVHGDVFAMPFTEAFDVAVCFGALGHFLPNDQPAFIAQVSKVLRRGGRFLFATSYMPPHFSRRYWISRAFNSAMHARNWLFRPHFIMFYLAFLAPEASKMLAQAGFDVEIRKHVFPAPFQEMCLIVATKK
jgi:ubiquinone/menaquinone biosynthesis C-methylase UbiE